MDQIQFIYQIKILKSYQNGHFDNKQTKIEFGLNFVIREIHKLFKTFTFLLDLTTLNARELMNFYLPFFEAEKRKTISDIGSLKFVTQHMKITTFPYPTDSLIHFKNRRLKKFNSYKAAKGNL